MKEWKLVFASRNAHKIKEISAMLGDYLENVTLLSLDDVGIEGEADETGATFCENALLKAEFAAKAGYISFADDSGLVVDALDGAPGVHSARYAGEHGNDALNRTLLLQNLKEKIDRSAAFVSAIACVFPDGRAPFVVEGRVTGEILYEERGEGGFGYDNLFWYEPLGRSFAELSPEEKNAVSHRRRALAAFAEALKKATQTT